MTDATGQSAIGHGHVDCVVQRHITDGREGPGGLYRCSHLLRLADGDLIIEAWTRTAQAFPPWRCLEVQALSPARLVKPRSQMLRREPSSSSAWPPYPGPPKPAELLIDCEEGRERCGGARRDAPGARA